MYRCCLFVVACIVMASLFYSIRYSFFFVSKQGFERERPEIRWCRRCQSKSWTWVTLWFGWHLENNAQMVWIFKDSVFYFVFVVPNVEWVSAYVLEWHFPETSTRHVWTAHCNSLRGLTTLFILRSQACAKKSCFGRMKMQHNWFRAFGGTPYPSCSCKLLLWRCVI